METKTDTLVVFSVNSYPRTPHIKRASDSDLKRQTNFWHLTCDIQRRIVFLIYFNTLLIFRNTDAILLFAEVGLEDLVRWAIHFNSSVFKPDYSVTVLFHQIF